MLEIFGKKYDLLREYCGGIALVMPGTASVKSNFSLTNWTKEPNSQVLTDFLLESILHCKQFAKLDNVMTQIND